MKDHLYYLIFGFEIPFEIFCSIKEYLCELDDFWQDKEFQDMIFFPVSQQEKCLTGLIIDQSPNYLLINDEIINEFTKRDEMNNYYNKYVPKVLRLWVDYIKSKTKELIDEGRKENEIKAILDPLEIYDSLNFKIYVTKG